MQYVKITTKGKQFGVSLLPRGETDPHVVLQLLCEDDEAWHDHGFAFSSYWIDDLIQQLQAAKAILDTMPKDRDGFGREFPAEEEPLVVPL